MSKTEYGEQKEGKIGKETDQQKKKRTRHCTPAMEQLNPETFEKLQDDVALAIFLANSRVACCCSGVRFLM